MVKVIYCFRRRPDLSDRQFDEHWAGLHASLGTQLPGLRRLVQSRALRIPGDTRSPDFDGVAELWFDDVESLLQARQSEQWHAASADEANFIDLASPAYLVAEERFIFPPAEV